MRSYKIVSVLLPMSGVAMTHAANEYVIEEIFVTAQRIEENASKVPIALNAFDNAMIEDRQIVALADLQIFSPNLNYTTTNTAQMTFSVRGVGTLVSSEAESGISLHINEVPLPPNQPPIEIYDVQRIEVLRGPQGTLYGRNATGGVINVVTEKPNFDTVGGYLDAEAGQHSLIRLRGALNVPVNDSLAFRVAGLSLERGGYTDNLAGGQVPDMSDDIDGRDLHSVRASATWRIAERSEVSVLYERFDENDDRAFTHNVLCKTSLVGAGNITGCEPGAFGLEPPNPSSTIYALTYGLRGITVQGARDAETGLVYRYPRPPITHLRDVHVDHEPTYELEQDVWQLSFRQQFDWGEVSLSGGYQQWGRFSSADDDNAVGHELNPIADVPGGVFPVSAVPGGSNGVSGDACNLDAGQFGVAGGCVFNANLTRAYTYTDNSDEQEQWSAEIKLRTELAGRFNFVAGVNYQSSKTKNLISHLSNEWDFVNQVGGLTDFGLFLRDTSPAFLFFSYPPAIVQEIATEFDSLSGFGEVYADLSENLTLTVGLRYNRDEKRIADRTVGFADAIDLNAPSIANGALGPGHVWARLQALQDPAHLDTLRAFYGVPAEVDPFSALLQIPFVPEINEQRLITGTPTKQTWDAWTGRAVLRWQPTPDVMLYGSYSRGYKPGGFNPGTTFFQALPGIDASVTYEREDVNAFEFGAKGLFWDDSFSVNVAGFFNSYEQLQIANNAQRLSPGSINDNVDAEMFGAELELRWRPHAAPRAEFELGYAWLNATLGNEPPRLDQLDVTGGNPDYVALGVPYQLPYVARAEEVLPLVDLAIAAGAAIGPAEAPAAQHPNGIPATFGPGFLTAFGVETLPWILVDVSGNRIPEAPEHTLHLAASYTWDLAGGALTARWDYYWQDDAFLTVFNRPSHRIHSWDQHNATLVFESGSGRWSARAWIKNIENDVHITGGLRTAFTDAFAATDPRAFGASVRWNFGAL